MVFEFEHAAMHGMPVLDGLVFLDQITFIALRNLYAAYKAGDISRESATKDKQKLVVEYKKQKAANEFKKKLTNHTTSLWKSIEYYQNEYRKNPSIEAANKLADAIDGKLKAYKLEVQECETE